MRSPCRVCRISRWVSRRTIGWPKFPTSILFHHSPRDQGVKVLQTSKVNRLEMLTLEISIPDIPLLFLKTFCISLYSQTSYSLSLHFLSSNQNFQLVYIYLSIIDLEQWGVDTKIEESNGGDIREEFVYKDIMLCLL